MRIRIEQGDMEYSMRSEEQHDLLLRLDDYENYWDQPSFNYDDLSKRIDAVKPCLENVCGLKLKRTDDVQDAFYICDLGIWLEEGYKHGAYCSIYFVRFSLLGNLVTVSHSCPVSIDTPGVRKRSAECLEKHGFVYVEDKVLHSRYDGQHRYFIENNMTWWDRFFAYE